MTRIIGRLAACAALLAGLLGAGTAMSQQRGEGAATAPQRGGTLRIYLGLSPASASIHEEATIATVAPFMAAFNNLFVFNQQAERNSVDDLTAELATEWRWNADNTRLTLQLRRGVTWHDGKPFTAADVKCTWDTITGKRDAGWRKNPRRDWYQNLREVTTNGDFEVSFQLERPQPSFMAFLASGFSPVYPCHVESRIMRQKPIGTGPFRVVSFNANTGMELERNPTYWREGRPYLDRISYRAVRNRATRHLAFASGEFDMTWTGDISPALMRDMQTQAPNAICEMRFSNVTGQVLMNREVAPFDNPDIRRAVALSIDREAYLKILGEGHFVVSGAMLPQPIGVWGVTGQDLSEAGVDGYTGTLEQRRAEAQRIMRAAGYGPNNPLRLKLITRDSPAYRDPAVLLIDHMKAIHIEAELQMLDTAVWYTTLLRNTWSIASNQSGTAIDDPDVFFYENYLCGSDRNYPRFCNRELQARMEQQSATVDPEARRRMVREIDIQLQREFARPITFQSAGGTCRWPYVRGITQANNSQYNHWRLEDAWMAPR